VSGVEAETVEGKVYQPARVVVGADGRRSVIARSVAARERDVHPGGTVAYWSYFSRLPDIAPTLRKSGRLAMACVPTNFDTHMVLVWGPQTERERFRDDLEGAFHRHLAAVAPDLAKVVTERGRRVEKFYGTADQTAYCRESAGHGWLLAGDAASFKDQCVAIGITHALRDAELAAEAIHRGLDGDLFAELQRYAGRREADLAGHFAFACQQALMNANTPEERALFRRLAADPGQGDRFMAMYGDALPVETFFHELSDEESHGSRKASAFP
jgi:2-polyprenyl-6-methoxyphenol hydroxylase-like FAD-dependent oxidoreductase